MDKKTFFSLIHLKLQNSAEYTFRQLCILLKNMLIFGKVLYHMETTLHFTFLSII